MKLDEATKELHKMRFLDKYLTKARKRLRNYIPKMERGCYDYYRKNAEKRGK